MSQRSKRKARFPFGIEFHPSKCREKIAPPRARGTVTMLQLRWRTCKSTSPAFPKAAFHQIRRRVDTATPVWLPRKLAGAPQSNDGYCCQRQRAGALISTTRPTAEKGKSIAVSWHCSPWVLAPADRHRCPSRTNPKGMLPSNRFAVGCSATKLAAGCADALAIAAE